MPDLKTRDDRERETMVALWLFFLEATQLGMWETFEANLRAAMVEPLAGTHYEAATAMAATRTVALPDTARESAVAWAAQQAAKLAQQIAETSRLQIQDGSAVAVVFSEERAWMIAVTETTAAITAGEALVVALWAAEDGREWIGIWKTEDDGKVCSICRPLDETRPDVWQRTAPAGPGAHPRCRCWLEYIAV